MFASRPAGGIYIFLYYYHVWLCGDRLGSPSDLVKSWGGGGVTVACRAPRRGWAYGSQYNRIYIDWGTRSCHSAVFCQGVHKWRETWVYK